MEGKLYKILPSAAKDSVYIQWRTATGCYDGGAYHRKDAEKYFKDKVWVKVSKLEALVKGWSSK